MIPFLLALTLLLGAVAPPAAAQDVSPDSAFAAGNAALAQNDPVTALAAYRLALRTDVTSAALLHNMGQAYLELGDLGQAILHFERAYRLAPRRAEVRDALHRARLQTEDAMAPPLSSFSVPPVWWFILGLMAYAAAFATTAVGLWRGFTPWRRRVVLGTAPLALVLTGLALYLSAATPHLAVVTAQEAVLHEAPTLTAPPRRTVHAGTTVTVRAELDQWLRVSLPTGQTGWLQAAAAEDVYPSGEHAPQPSP